MSGLPLAFLNPWLLTALIALPALYFLLRLIPPRPRSVHFPPLRLLLDIVPKEETAARTPWWLVLLRLGLAAFVILALAGPVLNPAPPAPPGGGPLVLMLDDGWPAASDWDARLLTAEAAINGAEASGRSIALLALNSEPQDIAVGTGAAAREKLRALVPQPYIRDRMTHLPALTALAGRTAGADLVWLAGGLDTGNGRAFSEALGKLGNGSRLTVHVPEHTARGLAGSDNSPQALTVRVLRADTGASETGIVRAFDLRGRPLGETQYNFSPSATETQARLELPIELRNEVARLDLAQNRSAAGVQLLDERWRRRAIGLVSGATADQAQPLLSPTYYLQRALEPFADVRPSNAGAPSEAILRFIEDGVPVIALADVGTITPEAQEAVRSWISKGGVLIRFAGSRLAAAENDDLVPVRLRRGGRVLGGALAWSTPQKLGEFPQNSPFAGLNIPEDVVVNRQVLAEPDPELAERSWAVLADGTPLVTAERSEAGLLVLFHVTADTVWSNLPISGLFVDMLRRTIALAGEAAPAATGADAANASQPVEAATLSPTRTLDGFGAFRSPPPTARPVPARGLTEGTPDHPPGIYGPPDGFIAVNTLAPDAKLTRLDLSNLPVSVRGYANAEPTPLAPWLLGGALLAFLIDTLVMLFLAGRMPRWGRRGVTAALVILAALAIAPQADAQQTDAKAVDAALKTRLAYVVTGDASVDEVSLAGLRGLGAQLAQRTAFEPGEPVGLDPAKDEMAFYPLIYWPVSETAQAPSSEALARIDAYMKRGGTILFDTRDAIYSSSGTSPAGTAGLRRILSGLDIPELEQVPADHVLTKSFYLLPDFPGRFRGAPLWVEAMPSVEEEESGAASPVRSGDGVSPILITSNDFAGAWAIDERGQTLLPTVPSDPRQRELAYRAGINIVMYALTGNYKADQVHIPALLERLGQ
ncbi:LytTR family transcriptional regulator [Terrihabitans soli]|uniref:LytTR family transcriptional regulator n=1 Tax=Terrihabitans soli TaxID=708113 RepID=A0A6S6QS39_9HYPH|nr:DUF4159 domain-containing protein [Terrihabitans soli]BCJ90092.1 LytTR family transcriptional regulator [Terrihabitans soli]